MCLAQRLGFRLIRWVWLLSTPAVFASFMRNSSVFHETLNNNFWRIFSIVQFALYLNTIDASLQCAMCNLKYRQIRPLPKPNVRIFSFICLFNYYLSLNNNILKISYHNSIPKVSHKDVTGSACKWHAICTLPSNLCTNEATYYTIV